MKRPARKFAAQVEKRSDRSSARPVSASRHPTAAARIPARKTRRSRLRTGLNSGPVSFILEPDSLTSTHSPVGQALSDTRPRKTVVSDQRPRRPHLREGMIASWFLVGLTSPRQPTLSRRVGPRRRNRAQEGDRPGREGQKRREREASPHLEGRAGPRWLARSGLATTRQEPGAPPPNLGPFIRRVRRGRGRQGAISTIEPEAVSATPPRSPPGSPGSAQGPPTAPGAQAHLPWRS